MEGGLPGKILDWAETWEGEALPVPPPAQDPDKRTGAEQVLPKFPSAVYKLLQRLLFHKTVDDLCGDQRKI